MKTITLNQKMSFNEALQYLLDGKCVGIRPMTNSNYIELFKPGWMNPDSPDYFLRWNDSIDNSDIRSNQFLEEWYPVVVDHRTISRC